MACCPLAHIAPSSQAFLTTIHLLTLRTDHLRMMRTNLAGAGRGIARANVRTLATTVISHSPHTPRMRLERWTMAAWGAFELSYAHFFGVATHYILELLACKSTRRHLERLQTYTTQLYLSFCKQFGTFVEVLWTCLICLVRSRQGILAKPMTSDTAVESLIKTSPASPDLLLRSTRPWVPQTFGNGFICCSGRRLGADSAHSIAQLQRRSSSSLCIIPALERSSVPLISVLMERRCRDTRSSNLPDHLAPVIGSFLPKYSYFD